MHRPARDSALHRQTPRSIRAVFFDLAGTLIQVRGGLGHQYASVASAFGVRAEPHDLERAFSRAFTEAGPMVFARLDAAEAASLEKGFWKKIVRGVVDQVGLIDRFGGRFDEYFERLFEHFATADAWTVFPDVVPMLEELRRAGLVVALITNFDYRVFRVVEAVRLAPLLDSITIPGLAGAAKPDAAIFEHALRVHRVQAPEALLVGDSIADDVEGGRSAGLNAVLIDRQTRYPESFFPRITSLMELPALLDAL